MKHVSERLVMQETQLMDQSNEFLAKFMAGH